MLITKSQKIEGTDVTVTLILLGERANEQLSRRERTYMAIAHHDNTESVRTPAGGVWNLPPAAYVVSGNEPAEATEASAMGVAVAALAAYGYHAPAPAPEAPAEPPADGPAGL